AFLRRHRSRLPLAVRQGAPGAWADWHLQPLLLRGAGRGARASRAPGASERAARTAGDEGLVEGPQQGHLQFRELSVQKRHADSQVLSPRVAERTGEAISRAPGPARKELEVLFHRHERARVLGPISGSV